MFGKKTPGESEGKISKIVLSEVPGTPETVYTEAVEDYSQVAGYSQVQATRWFVVSMALLVLTVTETLTIATMLPLKEIRPWIVETNATTGVVSKPVEIQKVDPNLNVIKAELARWSEAVFTIDPVRSNELMKWANVRAADKAVSQFAEFRQNEKVFERIAQEPGLMRDAKVTAVDATQKGAAFVFLTTNERVGTSSAVTKTKRYRLTLNYSLYSATQESDLLANPLGLRVTYFSYVEERAP